MDMVLEEGEIVGEREIEDNGIKIKAGKQGSRR